MPQDLQMICGASNLAAHQSLPQTGVPLLEAYTGLAPLLVHLGQSVLQLWGFLSSQVDRQHDRLVASKELLHLLQKDKTHEYKHKQPVPFITSVTFLLK